MSSFLFSSYLLHFNCKFVMQKSAEGKSDFSPRRWLSFTWDACLANGWVATAALITCSQPQA